MVIKKIQNSPDTLVDETLEGYMLLNPPFIELIPGMRAVVRKPEFRKEKGKVKLMIGGGSGHEPAPFQMVCPYGYDLFIAGDIYAAPSWMTMVKAIEACDDGSPILLTVGNHAGDVLNSNMAMEMLLSKGVNIKMFLSYDDVATAPKGRESERRGLLGALSRVVGVAAEKGEPLDEVFRLAEKARDNSRGYGVGIRSAIHPVTGLPIMPMPDDEIEMGIGMHGESSGNRIKMPSSKELAKIVSDILIDDLELKSGEEIAILINGLGGMTWMEFSIFYKDVYRYVAEKGLKVFDGSCGKGATTQELGGFLMAFGRVDDEIKSLWRPKE